MIVKKYIKATIQNLDRLYNVAGTTESIYYSKLAIIELCGWIELSMDHSLDRYVAIHLVSTPIKNIYNNVKKNNHGFDYKDNFRKMMYQTIGLKNTEIVQMRIGLSRISLLEAELDNLKRLRNDAAHTNINTTTIYQAPSVTLNQLNTIYPILRDIHHEIINL